MKQTHRPPRSIYPAQNRHMRRRTRVLAGLVAVLCFGGLLARLFTLQILDPSGYANRAAAQQLRDTTLPAARGEIYSADGVTLAASKTCWTIRASPRELADELVQPAAKALSEILNIDYDATLQKLSKRTSNDCLLRRRVDADLADAVRAWCTQNNALGIQILQDTKRVYPQGNFMGCLLGFTDVDNQGLWGLELQYDAQLTGRNGTILTAKNAWGYDMPTHYSTLQDAVPGNDITLTIRADIQHYLESALSAAVAEHHVAARAVGIVMEVDTGAILAMSTKPDYDPNDPRTIVDETIRQQVNALSGEERSKALQTAQQAQWRNKAISDTYEPGSTFKIITLAIALEEGATAPSDSFYCGGSMTGQGRGKPLKCWKTIGHGPQTLTQAAQHSCNVAFATLGLRIGEETFYRYCESFGFFRASENPDASLTGKTGISLPGESGSIWWPRSVFCNSENFSQLAAASFGQTFNITPLQLITAVSACCNGGYLMKPYIVDSVTDGTGALVSKTEPEVLRQVISEKTSAQVNAVLEQVVCDTKQGTGKNAYVAGYHIAGKTGTSEKVAQDAAGGKKEYIVSFIGYAPADDPQVVCLVLMDTPSNESGIYISGGQMAAPVVGRILGEVLPYLGVQPQYSEAEEKYIDRAVPPLTGKTPEEAVKLLREAGLAARIEGTGDIVTGQLPGKGTVVASGTTVLIYTGEIPEAEEETVPELTGLTYTEAREALFSRGLFLRSDSTILADSDTVRVVFQSTGAGESVPTGSVIEVSIVNDDNDTYGRY